MENGLVTLSVSSLLPKLKRKALNSFLSVPSMHFLLFHTGVNCGISVMVMLNVWKANDEAHSISDKVVLSHHAVNIVLKPASVNVAPSNLKCK